METKLTLNKTRHLADRMQEQKQHTLTYIRLLHATKTLRMKTLKTHRVQPIPPKSQNQT